MPTYEYLCKCGKEFEEFQSIKAEPVAKCPACGKQAKRQISAGAGLIFKGSGFYITDYKKQNSSPAGSEKSDSGSKPADSASGSASGPSAPVAA
jgi:putative FmdB family regulatory protein